MATWHSNRFRDHHGAQGLSPKAALLAYLLATHVRENDRFQIQGRRLAEQAGLHENSVKRAAVELEAAGIISRERVGRRSATLYSWAMVCPIGCEKRHHSSGKVDAGGTWVSKATNGAASHEVKATLDSGLDHPVESEWYLTGTTSGTPQVLLINNKDFSEIDKNLFLSMDNEKERLELETLTVQAIEGALLKLLASAGASVDHEAELELITDTYHRSGMAQAAIALWFDKCSDKTARSWGRYLSRCISNDPTAISCEYDGDLASSLYSAISSWNKAATGHLWRDLSDESKDLCRYVLGVGEPLADDVITFILSGSPADVNRWLETIPSDAPESDDVAALADEYSLQPAQEYSAESEPLLGVPEANRRWLGNITSTYAISYMEAMNDLGLVIPPGTDIPGAGQLVVNERKRRAALLEEELLTVEEAKAGTLTSL
jgi:DNA-binding Lrp family transcriptional regulator